MAIIVTGNRPLEEHKIRYAHTLPSPSSSSSSAHSLSSAMDIVRPSVLIGVSAQGGAFTTEVLGKMKSYSHLPQVFSLSNPTSKAECTATEAYKALDGKVRSYAMVVICSVCYSDDALQ